MAHRWDITRKRKKVSYSKFVAEGFSTTIREERRRLGMSLNQFAAHVGTSVASVKRWEAGSSVPCAAHREAILNTIHQGSRPTFETWRCHPGWWLRLCRHRRCLSIRQAADLSQTSPLAWQRYESGQSPLGLTQAGELSQRLGEEIPGLHLRSVHGIEEAIREAESEPYPASSGAILVSSLLYLEAQRPAMEESVYAELGARAHASLGAFLMHLGDPDLCGQAYRAATRLSRQAKHPLTNIETIRIGAIWTGFPHAKEHTEAARRFVWLEQKLEKLPPSAQSEFSVMRAMFAEWSGQPRLARESLGRGFCDPAAGSPSTLKELMSAWLYAKSGDVTHALDQAQPWLGHPDFHKAFLAHKVAMEAHIQVGEHEAALRHFHTLELLCHAHGYWAPDLASRGRMLRQVLSDE